MLWEHFQRFCLFYEVVLFLNREPWIVQLLDSLLTFERWCSEENPKPYTVFALLSAHWPNFCDVFVNVMLGVMVLFIIAYKNKQTIMTVLYLVKEFTSSKQHTLNTLQKYMLKCRIPVIPCIWNTVLLAKWNRTDWLLKSNTIQAQNKL